MDCARSPRQKLRRSGDSARLLALANMAGADAIITSWDSKVRYVVWRPLTAIREAATDDNPIRLRIRPGNL